MTEEETKKIKHDLWDWGSALYYCERKQEEIQRLEALIEDMRQGRSLEITGMPKGSHVSNITQNAAVKIVGTYTVAIDELTGEIGKIMRHKRQMDRVVADLPGEQKKLLELRYIKGYGWDHLPLHMHFSRAQCFRIHDKTLAALNLRLNETKFDL